MDGDKNNLIGQVFWELKVKSRSEDYIKPSGQRIRQWLCECSCEDHNVIIVREDNLKSGHTKSCGCIRKKYNNYILNLEDEYGLYGIGYCSNTNSQFYFDMDDYDKIKDICWCEAVVHGLHCVVGKSTDSKKVITMHLFLGYKGYDHADRNELNNRRYNLRIATVVENGQNKSKSTRNTSGVIGVSWNKRNQKWGSYIKYKSKLTHLGLFVNKDEAIRTRLLKEKECFGDFAPQRHLFEQYNV